MQTIHVKNPRALADPTLRLFLVEALSSSTLPYEDPEAAAEALWAQVVAGQGAMHLALEGGIYWGVALTLLPNGPLNGAPRVVVFYVRKRAPKGTKSGLIQALVDYIRENGYTWGWAINATGSRDSVYKRAFRKAGKIRKLGSIMEFQLQ